MTGTVAAVQAREYVGESAGAWAVVVVGCVVVVVVGCVVVVVVVVVVAVVVVVVVVVVPPDPPLFVAVATVCAPVLVQVMGMLVAPIAMVRLKGLVLVNCGSATLRGPLEPAVMVPVCVAWMTAPALAGHVAGTTKLPLRVSDGLPDPLPTMRGMEPEKDTVLPAVVSGSRLVGNSRTTPSPPSGPLSRFTPVGFVLALYKPNAELGTSAPFAIRASVAPGFTGSDAKTPSVITEGRLTGIPEALHVRA